MGEKGIRVNAISAGPIKTLAASAIGDAKFLYKWNEDHSLLKRNVDIHDVGNSALYLLSDLAGGVTGEIHYVDAGYNKVGMPNPKNYLLLKQQLVCLIDSLTLPLSKPITLTVTSSPSLTTSVTFSTLLGASSDI